MSLKKAGKNLDKIWEVDDSSLLFPGMGENPFSGVFMIEFNKGIRVVGTDLWLDSTKARPLGFISHAHGDHTARHKQVLSTPATWALCRKRLGDRREAMSLDFGVTRNLGDFSVELFSAGHILGSAQILIQNGRRIVYTGDFRLRKSRTAAPIEIRKCDTLIMECTFGKPRYVFPERAVVEDQLNRFIETAFDDRKVPVLFAYGMGKSQEVLKFLGEKGYTVCLTRHTLDVVKIYESQGVVFKNYEPLYWGNLYGKVVLIPPFLARTRKIMQIPNKRTAVLTGWAVDPGTAEKFGADEAFPYSDHAGFDELKDYVRQVSPEKIYTVHGSPEFAGHLINEGWDAEHLTPGAQLSLW